MVKSRFQMTRVPMHLTQIVLFYTVEKTVGVLVAQRVDIAIGADKEMHAAVKISHQIQRFARLRQVSKHPIMNVSNQDLLRFGTVLVKRTKPVANKPRLARHKPLG